ncbi:MAG: hypothetical protein LM582_03430 [Desulfurococcaceae archaeon]|nr:hypothetical protein [Desulfurococcaceae archaeon]
MKSGEELRKTLAKQICEALKLIYLKGLITPLTGNISIRIGDREHNTYNTFIFYPNNKVKVRA